MMEILFQVIAAVLPGASLAFLRCNAADDWEDTLDRISEGADIESNDSPMLQAELVSVSGMTGCEHLHIRQGPALSVGCRYPP